jgi:hypothetical protein
MGAVVVGVDVGQKHDPTAIAVAEAETRDGACHFTIRHLERLALGTTYPGVAARVAQVQAGIVARTRSAPKLYVDATGIGSALLDLLRSVGVYATATYFTHGDRRVVDEDGVKLGKAWLVSRLQVLLQCGQIHLPKTAEAEALTRELLDYEIRIDEQANDRYGAFRVGTHDDLVTALGLAVQEDAGLPWWLWSTGDDRVEISPF